MYRYGIQGAQWPVVRLVASGYFQPARNKAINYLFTKLKTSDMSQPNPEIWDWEKHILQKPGVH